MLIVPLLCTNFKPNATSTIENRNLANFPSLYDQSGKKNEQWITDFETWFNDNIGFRKNLFSMNSKIQYDIFNNSASSKVVVGDDGWLFLNQSYNMEIATGEYPYFDEDILEKICQQQILIQKKLAVQGIEYVLILPPSKISIYPEYLKGNFSVTRTPADMLADYLEEHTDIKIVRIKDALLTEKEKTDNLLYFKTDTHWNAYGCYIGYKEIVDKLNEWNITDSAPTNVNFINSSEIHDLTGMMVKPNEKYFEDNISTCEILNTTAKKISEGETYDAIQNYAADKSVRRADYYVNSKENLPSVAVFGDSMFLDWMEPLMAESSSELTCIWQYDITQELIDIVKPDVVFLEITERNLNTMPSCSLDFIYCTTTLQENSILEVTYCDLGEYEKMWFPAWSNENGQDDLVWYEAERIDDQTWRASIDLTQHKSNGNYTFHFYQGNGTLEDATFVFSKTYNVGTIF